MSSAGCAAERVVDDDHAGVDHAASRGLVAGEGQERGGAHEDRDHSP